MRDTDADWRQLGATEPYWGVLTHPDYKAANLTPRALESFYATGVDYMAGIVEALARTTGGAPGGRALDFGCGTGRLTEAMCAYADQVTGYDISPGMLEKARARGGRAAYVDVAPAGPFDWINSFIVFQHIPPERGLELIGDLLGRLAPGGRVSLQVTVWREPHLQPRRPSGWRRLAGPLLSAWRGRRAKTGLIMMYDYDLSEVVKRFNQAGVAELTLVSTDHGGHHGVILLGRKSA
jgi:SAM-dependent methyltransferase